MKRYLFNPENGVYEGETFDESGIINHEEGITALAPPEYGPGLVPVFDRMACEWLLLPIKEVRRLLTSV